MDKKVCYDDLSAHLLELLEKEHYSKHTLRDMKFILKTFSAYMKRKNLTDYSPEIGEELVAYCKNELHVCPSRVSRAKNIVGKLNRLLLESDGRVALWSYHSPLLVLPDNFKTILDEYLFFCRENGNRETTLQYKEWICTRFLHALSEHGCSNIVELTGADVQAAFLSLNHMRYWERIGPFLRFLYHKNLVKCDFSRIILYRKKQEIFPTTYSPKEIADIEDSIDSAVPGGIRDLAIILLLSRYGIRACDIAALTFDNIDFTMNRISFIQQKTGDPWEAELLPEIKTVLLNYINNVRPQNTRHKEIFLTLMIPFKPVDYRIINTMVGERIKESTVDINGRKHGSRIFRSSLASNMVNDKLSTEVVRKVLGHGTKYALKHYVKIDIESMKLCALPVPEPTGHFAELLKMKEAE
jgi:site-specific recombinase XerD